MKESEKSLVASGPAAIIVPHVPDPTLGVPFHGVVAPEITAQVDCAWMDEDGSSLGNDMVEEASIFRSDTNSQRGWGKETESFIAYNVEAWESIKLVCIDRVKIGSRIREAGAEFVTRFCLHLRALAQHNDTPGKCGGSGLVARD